LKCFPSSLTKDPKLAAVKNHLSLDDFKGEMEANVIDLAKIQ